MGKAQRLRRLRQASTPTDPLPTLQRLRAWFEQLPWDGDEPAGLAWHSDALMFTLDEWADLGHNTTSHAGNVKDGCWLCWRYTAEAMASWIADEPIPPAPGHWEAYCRFWYAEAFDA